MFQVHPKYIKRQKIRLLQRVINGLTAFANTFHNGVGGIIGAPIAGLQAFAIFETKVIDEEKMAQDMPDQTEDGEESEDDTQVVRLEVMSPDDNEEWKKRHRELFENGEED